MLNHIIELNPLTWIGDKLFDYSPLLSNLSQYFSSLFLQNISDTAQRFLFGLGLISLSFSFGRFFFNQYKFWKFLPSHIQNTRSFDPHKLKQKYGSCYVLVTGAADGIGFAYSKQFAKLGFNLIMADIQGQKLELKKKQLLQYYLNIKIATFKVDMSSINQIKNFVEEVKKFDVGIIINNVGLGGGGKYFEIDTKIIVKTLIVNFQPAYYINLGLIPNLRKRENRSAIINIASGTGIHLSHNMGVYGAVKCWLDSYSRTLSLQNKDKIDILSLRPFGVTTNMMRMKKMQRMITPKQCAIASLTELGKTDATFGGFPHKILSSYFGSLTDQIRYQQYQKLWERSRK